MSSYIIQFDPLTTLLLIPFVILLTVHFLVIRPVEPNIHPFILGQQSDYDPIRKKGESPVFRRYGTGWGLGGIGRGLEKDVKGLAGLIKKGGENGAGLNGVDGAKVEEEWKALVEDLGGRVEPAGEEEKGGDRIALRFSEPKLVISDLNTISSTQAVLSTFSSGVQRPSRLDRILVFIDTTNGQDTRLVGLSVVLAGIYSGSHVRIAKDSTEPQVLEEVKSLQPTIVIGSTRVLTLLSSHITSNTTATGAIATFSRLVKSKHLREGYLNPSSPWDALSGTRQCRASIGLSSLRAVGVFLDPSSSISPTSLSTYLLGFSVPVIRFSHLPNKVFGPVSSTIPFDFQVLNGGSHVGSLVQGLEGRIMGVGDDEVVERVESVGLLFVKGANVLPSASATPKTVDAHDAGWIDTGVKTELLTNGTLRFL